jgi:hypothetical protein
MDASDVPSAFERRGQPRPDDRQRLRLGRRGAIDETRHGDEHRVAGRMGLMARDVETPQAEREVDRVDVLERLRQIGNVQREKDQRQRAGNQNGAGWRQPRSPRRDAAAILR